MRSNTFTYMARRKAGGILRAAFALSLLLVCGEVLAQKHPERKHIRAGNKDYESLDYGSAESDYRAAMGKTPASYEAAFNLADALYKQERYEEAAGILGELAKRPVLPAETRNMIADESQRQQFITPEQRAKTMYNLGNAQFQQQKLQESLESYKQSLMSNPNDIEAKYNLAYVQKLLEQQQDDQNNDQNNDQNKDDQNKDNKNNDQNQQDQNQNQDQDQGDQGDRQDENNDESDSQPDEQQSDKPDPAESQPQEAAISKDDAEKMLQAIQSQEDKTREKMDEKKNAVVAPSGKNW